MKKYDEYLLDSGYSITELVDKASDCLVKHIDGNSMSFLCGPGNNGADGLSSAIKKKNQGCQVKVFIFEREKISLANKYYLEQCLLEDIEVCLITEQNLKLVIEQLKNSDVVVDAMFGFGLNSTPRGLYQNIIDAINLIENIHVIAVDIPSGLNGDTGYAYECVLKADKTISLTCLKNGFLNPESYLYTGKVIVEKLDVDNNFQAVGLYKWADEKVVLPIIKERKYDGHKGTYGHVGMITGCDEYKGASLMSTKSCVYSGSGVVTTITKSQVIQALTQYCPEATTVLRPSRFQKVDFEKYDALLVGSGLGLTRDAYHYVEDVFQLTTKPLVVDGDALTILSTHKELLLLQNREVILTPHMKEFERLCPDFDETNLLEVASSFAKKYHVVLVLKGPHTMISDGTVSYRVSTGNKAMSVGGMGDVLAGMITSFLGQGYSALESALLGVYIHGYIGDVIAKNAYSVIPSRLIEYIPQIMHELLMKKNNL